MMCVSIDLSTCNKKLNNKRRMGKEFCGCECPPVQPAGLPGLFGSELIGRAAGDGKLLGHGYRIDRVGWGGANVAGLWYLGMVGSLFNGGCSAPTPLWQMRRNLHKE